MRIAFFDALKMAMSAQPQKFICPIIVRQASLAVMGLFVTYRGRNLKNDEQGVLRFPS
jgi:hypothetical protein